MPVREWAQGFTPPTDDAADPVQAFRDGVIAEYGRDEAAWHAQESRLTEENTSLAKDLKDAQAANWALMQQLPASKANEPPKPPETEQTQEQKLSEIRSRIFKTVDAS